MVFKIIHEIFKVSFFDLQYLILYTSLAYHPVPIAKKFDRVKAIPRIILGINALKDLKLNVMVHVMRYLKYSLLIVFIIFLSYSGSMAAPENQAPVQIEADQMMSLQKDNSVFFSGKVEARQEGMIIHADEMNVYYGDAAAAGKDKQASMVGKKMDIERIFAKGNVEITQDDWVATGDSAEYFAVERKVVLTGNTKVWQDNNMVTGERFVMYLDEGKSIIERSSKKGERVKAFFYPGSKRK